MGTTSGTITPVIHGPSHADTNLGQVLLAAGVLLNDFSETSNTTPKIAVMRTTEIRKG